jgi:hypothetical protein
MFSCYGIFRRKTAGSPEKSSISAYIVGLSTKNRTFLPALWRPRGRGLQ